MGGKTSGIKWDGVSKVQTQETVETIGSDVQLVLRDPRTKQEWVTSSIDYINALVALGVITSGGGSGWELTGNAGTNSSANFIGTTDGEDFIIQPNTGNIGIGHIAPVYKFDLIGDFSLYEASGYHIHQIYNNGAQGLMYIIADDSSGANVIRARARFGGDLSLETSDQTTSEGSQIAIGIADLSMSATSNGNIYTKLQIKPTDFTVVNESESLVTVLHNGNVGIGTLSPVSKLTVDGDIEILDNANGLILVSPDATRYRVTVANGGTLTVTAV